MPTQPHTNPYAQSTRLLSRGSLTQCWQDPADVITSFIRQLRAAAHCGAVSKLHSHPGPICNFALTSYAIGCNPRPLPRTAESAGTESVQPADHTSTRWWQASYTLCRGLQALLCSDSEQSACHLFTQIVRSTPCSALHAMKLLLHEPSRVASVQLHGAKHCNVHPNLHPNLGT